MKLFVLIATILACASVAYGNDIWSTLQDGQFNDAEVMDILEEGVFKALNAFPGDPCLADDFGNQEPSQNSQNTWTAWLCSFWNPSAANTTVGNRQDDCKVTGVSSDLATALTYMDIIHFNVEVTDSEYDQVVEILTRSIQSAGGYSNAVYNTMLTDLNDNAMDSIINVVASTPCATSDIELDWQVNVDYTEQIAVGDQISFKWTDQLLHSVETADGLLLAGFGANDFTLSNADKDCVAGDNTTACDPLGLTEYVYAKKFTIGGAYDICCPVHGCASMQARILVGPQSESESTIGSSGIPSGSGDEGSPASIVSSWLF